MSVIGGCEFIDSIQDQCRAFAKFSTQFSRFNARNWQIGTPAIGLVAEIKGGGDWLTFARQTHSRMVKPVLF